MMSLGGETSSKLNEAAGKPAASFVLVRKAITALLASRFTRA
jgi:hypothetical protein